MRRGSEAKLHRQDGFLYVEVLVSMFILSLALLALVPMFVTAAAENSAAQDHTFAAALAQAKIEELKVTDFDTLADGNDSVASHGISFTRTWAVSDDTPHAGMKTMTVTVTPVRNQTFGQSRSAVVSFYRAL